MLRQGCLWLLLLVPATPVCADIYRWTDASGQVHFADRPVAGNARKVVPQDVQNVYQSQTPPVTDPAHDDRQQERDAREARRQRRVRQEQADQLAAKRRQQCEKARSDARKNALRVVKNGSLAALQKKQQRRETLNGRIKRYCY